MSKTESVEKIKLEQLSIGQVYYLSDPVRVAKIVATEKIEMQTPTGVEQTTAFIAEVRMASKPIPGFISESHARTVKRDLEPGLETSGQAQWRETWCNRNVHPMAINRAHGGFAYRDEKRWELELAVLSEEGRQDRLMRTSAIKNKPIIGAEVAESCWPQKTKPAEPKPAEVAPKPAETAAKTKVADPKTVVKPKPDSKPSGDVS